MAKSIRSSSHKKNKAVKRETVFKPAHDARIERIAAREALASAAAMQTSEEGTKKEDSLEKTHMETEVNVASKPTVHGKKGKWRRNQKREFNAYGLSSKETKF